MARYALSDIHGCLATFRTMVEEILQLRPQDHLYLLGDYINKGPDSKGVLDYLLALQQKGYQLTCLRGNHDQLLLDAVDQGEQTVWLPEAEKQKTLQNFGVQQFRDIPSQYIVFIRAMPLLVVLEDYILVHAGLDFSLPNPLLTSNHLLMNTKRMQPSRAKLGKRVLLHGHVPVTATTIRKATAKNMAAINLDAGCTYYRNDEFGQLCALDLDEVELFFLKNTEEPYPINIK